MQNTCHNPYEKLNTPKNENILDEDMVKCRENGSEIVISCGVDCFLPDMPSVNFVFAVLNTVLPSITKLDIQETHIT